MKSRARNLAIFLLALAGGAGCAADQGCPPFAHIVGGDFGRNGNMLWWTLQVEQLSPLTFNQSAVPANFLEYRWGIDIDSDRDGAVDLRAAIQHFAMINATPVTTADILSQTSDDLLAVMGGVASNIGSFTASIDAATNTFRFDTTTAAAAGLANVTDRAQSTWHTVYRSGADVEDQCDEQWP
ncbi:MAG TPA: hypothetical protein VKQ32_07415 [Polyangia bacterium]|nr:hypothetical protein [Polyangia bacterium]